MELIYSIGPAEITDLDLDLISKILVHRGADQQIKTRNASFYRCKEDGKVGFNLKLMKIQLYLKYLKTDDLSDLSLVSSKVFLSIYIYLAI